MSTAASHSHARMHVRTELDKRGSRAPTTDLQAVATDARRVNCRRRQPFFHPETPGIWYQEPSWRLKVQIVARSCGVHTMLRRSAFASGLADMPRATNRTQGSSPVESEQPMAVLVMRSAENPLHSRITSVLGPKQAPGSALPLLTRGHE